MTDSQLFSTHGLLDITRTNMKITEIINEHVVNAFDPTQKLKYADEVWDILQKSYANVEGGFGTASSIEELIEKSSLWKLVTRDGRVTAVAIYRDQLGRKSIASGTDGSRQGKADYMMIKNADVKLRRAWAEVSGAPEALMKRTGLKALPSKFAPVLTGKEILEYNDDGYHYTRLIGGQPHEKVIYGAVQLDQATIDKLTAMGIELHDLPSNS